MYSIREVCAFIYELEEELDLVSLQYEGSYVYSFLRTRIFTEVEKQLGLLAIPHDIPPLRNRWQKYFDYFYYDWKFLLHRKTYDILVIEHERQVRVDEVPVDIYTDAFVKQRETTQSVMCIRRSPKRSNLKSKGKEIFLRQGFLDRFDSELQTLMKKQDRLPEFDELSRRLQEQYSIQMDVNAMFLVEWPKFIRYKSRFKRWLLKYRPKEVVVVVGYYCYEFIEACKEEHILVSEIQHGIINKNHSGYYYPHHTSVPYFVDKFYGFGSYWTTVCPLPLKSNLIEYIGFQHFRSQRTQYSLRKHPYQVLVISQGTIGAHLVEMTIALALTYPEYIFIYKLHPGEFLNYTQRYPDLLSAPENVLVVKQEIPLYQWMSSASYVLGAYSTAIYEALAMKCKVMLIEVDGVHDYMEDLIDNHMVSILRSPEEFMQVKEEQVNVFEESIV